MGTKLAGIMTILLIAGAGLFYWYYTSTQERIGVLRENQARLEVAVQTSEASIKTLNEETARLNALNSDLQTELRKAEQYGDELRATLRRHDLTDLADRKPGLIEKRMQDATNELWDDLRNVTSPSGL